MPEDTIVKALNDLTQALEERKNKKGSDQIEALQKIDELLNKVPMKTTSEQSKAPPDSIRSAKQDDNYGASNIVLPCPGS